jgi:hypothetical protein
VIPVTLSRSHWLDDDHVDTEASAAGAKKLAIKNEDLKTWPE